MSAALLAGLLAGAGIWLAWSGLRPPPEPLGVVLARIGRPPVEPTVVVDAGLDRDMRIGSFLLRHLPVLARSVERGQADLRIVGRSAEEQATRVGTYVVFFLVLGPWVRFLGWLFGIQLPIFIPGAVALGGAVWGIVMPFASLRREARARRQAFAHALSAWCDVVVMTLAAGRGAEQAMETAAAAGRGWAFAEIRGALHAGYMRGETPWEALEKLGAELGISDLSELGSTISMAGEEGASVRATVVAKARTIRERITAESEYASAAATERMGLPSVMLVFGFLLFLGFPALVAIFSMSGQTN